MDSAKGKLPSQLGFADSEPYSVQHLKLQSQRHIKLSCLSKTEDTLMASQDVPIVLQPSPAPSGPKEKPIQMVLTDDLRAHIGDVLACDLELEQPQFPKVLASPRSRGKPEDMQKLLDFLHRSVHDACINRKTTIAALTVWITALS